ncbi:MAG: hypothetical protein SVS85_03375 [Candidatus Nanohaloarchaea archaeon]|nr:hypothetical protein [Candidatus Nanohaloarchaea archaeon]
MVAWRDALEDAEAYLEKAEDGFPEDDGRITVSLCSLSLIRASDALFHNFYGETPKRHDYNAAWFERLYHKDGHIDAKYNTYKGTLDKWVKSEKAKAHHTVLGERCSN